MANVLLGVTGGIAAYKACELARLLRKQGHEVTAVLTDEAAEFVSELTFATLTGRRAYRELFHRGAPGVEGALEHVPLARWGHVLLVAPATANFLGKLACGLADDLLSCVAATALGTIPVVLAPAMNESMWRNPFVQRNVAALKEAGCLVVPPGEGELACGEAGVGRLAALEDIAAALARALEAPKGR